MSEFTRKLMSATEFCHWDDGTDTRCEQVDFTPAAIRLRKRHLDANERKRASRQKEVA